MLDTRNKKRQVVLPGKKRVVGVENPVEEFKYNQSNEVPLIDTSILPVILVSELTPYLRDGRKEVAPMAKRRQKRQVVLLGKKRVVELENLVDEEEFNQSNEVPPLDTSILPMILASELTPYLRDGHKEVAPVPKRRGKWQVRKKKCEFLNNVQSHF